MKISGDLQGIKQYLLDELDSLPGTSMDKHLPCAPAVAARILEISREINREIALIINRSGLICAVAVGDHSKVSLPDVGSRRSEQRLSGLRCVHTHPSGSAALSPQDLSSLTSNRYDLIAAIAMDNTGPVAAFAVLDSNFSASDNTWLDLDDFCALDMQPLLSALDNQFNKQPFINEELETERVILAGIEQSSGQSAESLDELALLAETAGAEIAGRLIQKRDKADPALFIGTGKIDELAALCQNNRARTVLFDDELSPAQQRNLEAALGLKIIDRTALILDIFAKRARSHEGKIQVELAQLRYRLTHLTGMGLVLSRLGGGIGTRGPGETRLESDRRRIRKRISDLEHETKNFIEQRRLQRARRSNSSITAIALIGYTNAGKSTLMNKLTAAGVLAEDKLFATLDPTTRKYTLPDGTPVLITDTVGFITKLPHMLIKAFRATLEETVHADLLLHVADCASSSCEQQCAAVASTISELGIANKPLLTVYNKIDKNLSNEYLHRLSARPDSVAISALTGQNLDALIEKISIFTRRRSIASTLLLPYEQAHLLGRIYEIATVTTCEYRDDGILLKVMAGPEWQDFFQPYSLSA